MGRSVLLICACTLMVFATAANCSASLIVDVKRYNSSVSKMPQIAPGPLVEGALSYTDRTYHCFRQIPQALIGAEYVQAANSDKNTEYYELDVTLSQPATLYLFIDHRMGHGHIGATDEIMEPQLDSAGMYWVQDLEFLDTGWKLGIDENGNGFINQYFSVFYKNVGPGTIKLYQQYDLTDHVDRNMYSVAAVVPEPATLALLALGATLAIRRQRA